MTGLKTIAGRREPSREEIVVDITHGDGLHARPAVIFTRLARSFPCLIELDVDGLEDWFNAKSIVKVMGARIRKGSRLTIRATGVNAAEAVAALAGLVENDFGEDANARQR